ncbi:MAG: DUF87 domain-containing protein [Gammaproteobacteria bacterium]|nr:DUF87 domain-containing protein [Gammaproteobacteria bacterium]
MSGATLILLAGLASAITVLTGMSWLNAIDTTGRFILTLHNLVKTRIEKYRKSKTTSDLETEPDFDSDYFSALSPPDFHTTGDAQSTPEEIIDAPQMIDNQLSQSKVSENEHDTNQMFSDDIDTDELYAFNEQEALDFRDPEPEINEPEAASGSTLKDPGLFILERQESEPAPVTNFQQSKPDTSRKLLPRGTIPPLDTLDSHQQRVKGYSKQNLEDMAVKVEKILGEFGVKSHVKEVHPGPVITRFELDLAPGTKASKVTNLSKDLARALLVTSVRVVEVIPGKPLVGLEIPNAEREIVTLKEVLSSQEYQEQESSVTMVLGKNISGQPVVADLAKMPHLLVAGTTGSGKSVAVNAFILSLLYKASPDEVKLIMIDPKMLELSVYEDIPHLLTPVVTDMKLASQALNWCVAEMERRYKLMSMLGVRNLKGFNQKVDMAKATGQPIKDPLFNSAENPEELTEIPTLEPLPLIVIVIDELADMMMIVGKKVEVLIARLAQKARAAGLHLILATQRPSVDVLTGLIKANVPSRISFQVSSKIDSRTVLDQGGAESLLGNGDMLFLPPGTSLPIRAHGAFVSDHEVHRVVDFIKRTGRPEYISTILEPDFEGSGFDSGSEAAAQDQDSLYDQAVYFVTQSRKASISSVQRKFRIGYNRAARIIEDMENSGVVSAAETNGSRTVLAPPPPGG